MPKLITGGLGDPADHGAADPGAAAALGAFAAGRGSEHAMLTALAGARLLVPVVVAPRPAGPVPEPGSAGSGHAGRGRRGEKVSEMMLPTVIGHDGRPAVMAFTCLASLGRWRPDARPVPVPAHLVWQAGLTEARAVVVDLAGPVPVAVDGARLAALAEGRPVPLPCQDPDVRAAAAQALTAEPVVAAFGLLPGEDGSDLTVDVTLAPGYGPAQAGVQAALARAAERIMAGAGDRVRRGITMAASVGGSAACCAG